MAWKQRGERARSSDESTQTVLRPAGSGPTELFCVPQVGGGARAPSLAFFRVRVGTKTPGCLKGTGAAATGHACKPCWGAFFWLQRAATRKLLAGAPLIFLIIS